MSVDLVDFKKLTCCSRGIYGIHLNITSLLRSMTMLCGTNNMLCVLLHHSDWMWGIFSIILSVPRNIVMELNNVVKLIKGKLQDHNMSHGGLRNTMILIGHVQTPPWTQMWSLFLKNHSRFCCCGSFGHLDAQSPNDCMFFLYLFAITILKFPGHVIHCWRCIFRTNGILQALKFLTFQLVNPPKKQ